jgi:uncharacterized coiled-coil protein SlyX
MRVLRNLCVVVVCVIAIMSGAALDAAAQGKDSLPKGRPFQMLQQRIANIDAQLAEQIADLQAQLTTLEGRVDAVEDYNAVQDALIGAMQAVLMLLEQRMTSAEATLADLEAWNAAQDMVLAQMNTRIGNLQAAMLSMHGQQQTLLFSLHNQQQAYIAQLQNAISFLTGQNNVQNARISSLQSQVAFVQNEYADTRMRLAQGCPPNSSIRQVIPGGPVICEQDTATGVVTARGFQTVSVGPVRYQTIIAGCPLAPAGSAPYVATGGGYSLAPDTPVISSAPTGERTWQVTVRNPRLSPMFATVYVQCVRNVP